MPIRRGSSSCPARSAPTPLAWRSFDHDPVWAVRFDEWRDRLADGLATSYRDDGIAYTEAKTAFILDALDRAARWADATAWRP